MELLFENISKSEKEDITLEIIKEMKKDIEKLVEVEVLKQLNGNKNSKSTKAVKEIVSKSMVNLFRTLFNRSAMWSNTLEENHKVGLNENDNSVLFHGTNSKFTNFNDTKPIFFVDNIDVARTYGDYIIKGNLNMNNPIELDFEGKSTYYFYDKWYLPSDLANKIKEISEDIKNRYMLDDDLINYLEDLNFSDNYGDLDGIIMKNISDAMGGMFSTHKPANNYVVFDKKQITIIE